MSSVLTRKRRAISVELPGKEFCEFFAGIGLVRDGLESSGWRCVYANDNNPLKRELYESRFGVTSHFHLGDVRDTSQVLRRIEGRPFLATASFPCTDLSLAGHWRGLNGEHSSAFFGFAEVIAALGPRRPMVVMLENVTGLITSNEGRDFTCLAAGLADLGYWLDALVLDAKYFVPQSRPRIFIIGVHESLETDVVARSKTRLCGKALQVVEEQNGALRPRRLLDLMKSQRLRTGWAISPIPVPPTSRKPLGSLIDLDVTQEWWEQDEVDRHYKMMSELHQTLVGELMQAGGTHVGTIFRRKRHGKTRAEVRFDGLAGCLRTPCGGSAKQIVIVVSHGELSMRWMSPREYARLQGADNFPLVAKTNQNLFGFGDAVCVPAIRWLDQHALSPIFDSVN